MPVSRKISELYTPLLNSLEDALSRPTFCCGGNLRPSEMKEFVLKMKSKSSAKADEENWREFKLSDLPLDKLLQYCDPAPFGDLVEMKTVVDSEVRLAYEVKSEGFKFETENKATRFLGMRMIGDFPGGRSIKKHIEETLTPGRYVSLDRYKLNVYSKGGFFKPHVDTPSGNEMIGTLVLCLPSPHRGGELCVNHDGLQHAFSIFPSILATLTGFSGQHSTATVYMKSNQLLRVTELPSRTTSLSQRRTTTLIRRASGLLVLLSR